MTLEIQLPIVGETVTYDAYKHSTYIRQVLHYTKGGVFVVKGDDGNVYEISLTDTGWKVLNHHPPGE